MAADLRSALKAAVMALPTYSVRPSWDSLPWDRVNTVRRARVLDAIDEALAAEPSDPGPLDALDGARLEYRECLEVRRLLGYLWTATGKNHLRPVHDLFDDADPIVEDVRRLAIFPDAAGDRP